MARATTFAVAENTKRLDISIDEVEFIIRSTYTEKSPSDKQENRKIPTE